MEWMKTKEKKRMQNVKKNNSDKPEKNIIIIKSFIFLMILFILC